ncbi:MAG: hypothetical protein J5895_03535 [Alphaproteobacteria bacterium]|nr:hypothetical protein [Alphaproteobacteria bacterium]
MKKIIIFCIAFLTACTNLTRAEQDQLQLLKSYGITVDRPVGNYEKPANPAAAGLLNLLPGVGNFYLASGNGADSSHWLYGAGNLIFWPFSVFWGIPEAVVDANNINKRELLYYYQYDQRGRQEIYQTGIRL